MEYAVSVMENKTNEKFSRLHSDNFTLKVKGDRQYETYLSLVPELTLQWVRLRKPLAGEITERAMLRWSAFSLTNSESVSDDELALTDFDLTVLGEYVLSPLPPDRIARATAQRSEYLSGVNSPRRLERLIKLQSNEKKYTIQPLWEGSFENDKFNEASDFKDWGYLTRFSAYEQSRDTLQRDGIYTRIGKRWRSVLCAAPMPDTIGSFDALWTSLCCHMLTVIPRNFQFAAVGRRLEMAKLLIQKTATLTIPNVHDECLLQYVRNAYRRNICVALSVQDDIDIFITLYNAGVRSFRLYSVATDIRIRRQVKRLTQEIVERSNSADPIELFVGQITSISQYDDLRDNLSLAQWEAIDGFFIGNGGGVRCKTAETGMIVNSPSLLLELRGRDGMGYKSLIVEGGVGDEPAIPLMFGASGLSYAAGIAGASIESPNGGLFIFDGRDYWAPQRGEASASAKIIESSFGDEEKHLYADGEPRQIEGTVGFLVQELQFVSMCGRIRTRNEWLAQCFVKLGVRNMEELHSLGVAMPTSALKRLFCSGAKEDASIKDLHIVTEDSKKEPWGLIPLPIQRRTEAMQSRAMALRTSEETLSHKSGAFR